MQLGLQLLDRSHFHNEKEPTGEKTRKEQDQLMPPRLLASECDIREMSLLDAPLLQCGRVGLFTLYELLQLVEISTSGIDGCRGLALLCLPEVYERLGRLMAKSFKIGD